MTRLPNPFEAPPSAARRGCLVAGLGLLASFAACGQSANPADSVTLDTARAELAAGRVKLFDIREPEEHATGVAPGAQLLPLSQLGRRLAELPNDPNQPVLLVCNTQNRSSATLRKLRERGGYSNVRFVQGGMSEWARRGWPLVKPGG